MDFKEIRSCFKYL